jgi:hypothetical protein
MTTTTTFAVQVYGFKSTAAAVAGAVLNKSDISVEWDGQMITSYNYVTYPSYPVQMPVLRDNVQDTLTAGKRHFVMGDILFEIVEA